MFLRLQPPHFYFCLHHFFFRPLTGLMEKFSFALLLEWSLSRTLFIFVYLMIGRPRKAGKTCMEFLRGYSHGRVLTPPPPRIQKSLPVWKNFFDVCPKRNVGNSFFLEFRLRNFISAGKN